MKRKLLFRGTGTALVTPFRRDGAVDEAALRALTDRQLAGGVEALLPVGTTGESVTLTESEQARVVEIVAERVNGRVPVIAGAGSNATAKAIALSKTMLSAGADAVLSVGPYYNKPTPEGFFRHFAAIAEAIDAPVVIYNVPGRTASNIDAATTLRLAAAVPAIAGVKEASGNLSQIMEILRGRPKGFAVWSGDDALTLPLMALGADGIVSVVSNELPAEFSKMVRLCLKGDFPKATVLHNRLLDLMNFNFIESNPIPVKCALAMMGLIGEYYRLPMVPLSEKHRPKLKQLLHDAGVRL